MQCKQGDGGKISSSISARICVHDIPFDRPRAAAVSLAENPMRLIYPISQAATLVFAFSARIPTRAFCEVRPQREIDGNLRSRGAPWRTYLVLCNPLTNRIFFKDDVDRKNEQVMRCTDSDRTSCKNHRFSSLMKLFPTQSIFRILAEAMAKPHRLPATASNCNIHSHGLLKPRRRIIINSVEFYLWLPVGSENS